MVQRKITNLVVVAHPDDEVLGFGATGAKLVVQGECVQPIILCGNVNSRSRRPTDRQLSEDIAAANGHLGFNQPVLGSMPNIRMNTVPHIDIVQFIELHIELFKPQRIFTHHPADLNDDHVQVARACLAAARLSQRKCEVDEAPSVYFMEIPSATDWAYPSDRGLFVPTVFSTVTGYVEKKIDALGCYRNVMRPFPHPRSAESIKALAAYRGGQSGTGSAEAFQVAFQRNFY